MRQISANDAHYRETRTVHWVMAFIFFFLALATDLLFDEVTNADQRTRVHNLHVSMGLLFFLLLLFRVYWLWNYRSLRASFEFVWQRWFAHLNYLILYFLMTLLILTGLASVVSAGDPLSFFGLFEYTPPPWLGNREVKYLARESHRYLTNGSYVFLGFHLLGAINFYLKPMTWKIFRRTS